MKTNSNITSNYMGIDIKVWWVMGICVVLSLGLMGYKRATSEPCIEFSISSKSISSNTPGNYSVGDDIRFTSSANEKDIIWHFGDSPEDEKGNAIISHSYSQEGKYDITATINGKCQSITTIYIHKATLSRNYELPTTAITITGKDTPQVNTGSIFITNAMANTYEWTVLNRNDYERQTGKMAAFIFKTPGRHTIQLKLDNDRQKVYTKDVYVIPASRRNGNIAPPLPMPHFNLPPPRPNPSSVPTDTSNNRRTVDPAPPPVPTETKPTARTIISVSDRYLLKAFEEVIKGSKRIAEFRDYFCNEFATKVLINNKDYKTFEEFFNDIKGNDKRRIEAVETLKEDNCIISLKVKAKKKGFLGRWVDL